MAGRTLASACWRVASRTFQLVGATVLITALTPLVNVWTAALAAPWYEAGSCESLILLAGSQAGDGVLGYSSYWRSVYAVQAARQHTFRLILISGGPEGDGAPTAKLMADFLVASGTPREIIRLEAESDSTRSNAVFTTRLLRDEPGCKTLMTSDFHMFRARRAFEKAGMKVVPVPVPDALKRASTRRNRWLVAADLATETVKITYYSWRGWI